MGTLKNNHFHGVSSVIVDGVDAALVQDVSMSESVETIELYAGCDIVAKDTRNVGKSLTGSLTFTAASPSLLAKLRGGTVITSGYGPIAGESITVGANVVIATASGLDGTFRVYTSGGKKIFGNAGLNGSPGIGEFATDGTATMVTGLIFNGSETETTVLVDYSAMTTDVEQLRVSGSDTPPYVSLSIKLCGANYESEADTYGEIWLPKVRFSNISENYVNKDYASFSADFTAIEDANGVLSEHNFEDA